MLFVATFLSLWSPYCCCRMFNKCQHRAWRIPLCIGAVFGIIGALLAVGTVIFSVIIGVSFYPVAEAGLSAVEEAGCSSFYFYTVYFFFVFTHVVSSIVVISFVIGMLFIGIHRLIKCTIFAWLDLTCSAINIINVFNAKKNLYTGRVGVVWL